MKVRLHTVRQKFREQGEAEAAHGASLRVPGLQLQRVREGVQAEGQAARPPQEGPQRRRQTGSRPPAPGPAAESTDFRLTAS